jgi:hypothetical protein
LFAYDKYKRQGKTKPLYTYAVFHTLYANMSAHIYTPSRILERKRRFNNKIDRFHCHPQGKSTWYPGGSSSSASLSSSETKDTVSDYLALHRPRPQKNTMILTHYSPTDDDEDYTSSDNDHLFMKDSPRRQSSNGTASPPHNTTTDQPSPPSRTRTLSRSTPICICRDPSSIASAASSAAAFSPVEPGIWSELRRLFHNGDPRKHFDILRRSTPVIDEQGNGFMLVEARVQAKDGSMVAKGEPCTDDVLSLRSLRNALIETRGERILPVENGEEIIAGRIEEFEKICSACGLPRY